MFIVALNKLTKYRTLTEIYSTKGGGFNFWCILEASEFSEASFKYKTLKQRLINQVRKGK